MLSVYLPALRRQSLSEKKIISVETVMRNTLEVSQ